MIDLHMHTTYSSDGSLSLSELLQLAEQKKLEIISITDHNSVDAYKELENPSIRKLFSGKIINGIELTTTCEGIVIEILSYGHDIEKMGKLLKSFPFNKYGTSTTAFSVFLAKKVTEKLNELGQNVNYEPMPAVELYKLVCKNHKSFLDKYDVQLAQNTHCLWRSGLSNINSPLHLDFSEFCLPYNKVIEVIKKCDGKAFLAHPAEYKENADLIISKTKHLVDGVECFHHSANKAYSEKLVRFAQENNLLISGGSDFHGKVSPHIDLGTGKGDLFIPKHLVDWI